jgi:Arc/MetJ family transcription regulator
MRTTLDIDDDVLAAAKELATSQKSTVGQVLSDLARTAMTRAAEKQPKYRNGFRLLPRTGKVITSELIEKLMEEEP